MQQLKVPFLNKISYLDSIDTASLALDKLDRQPIDHVPWPAHPYKPEVKFVIAHSTECIFLKYYVDEKFIKAAAGNTNGAVWQDACVEFFIAFDDKGYYNFEFNCIGTTLLGFGEGKTGRELLPEGIINKIKYRVCIENKYAVNIHWELTVAIPLEVFTHHKISFLRGKSCRAAFYKCGDELQDPHFLSWTAIQSPEPDFHLPQFFGDLIFE
jgi:hypothetical protein